MRETRKRQEELEPKDSPKNLRRMQRNLSIRRVSKRLKNPSRTLKISKESGKTNENRRELGRVGKCREEPGRAGESEGEPKLRNSTKIHEYYKAMQIEGKLERTQVNQIQLKKSLKRTMVPEGEPGGDRGKKMKF